MDDHEAPQTLPGQRAGAWVRTHRWPILWALLLLAVLPMRDLWAPDEPDFAQHVKEMAQRGTWLLPYQNGVPYDEKPILFYWLMRGCSALGQWFTGGAGALQGVAPWALRLPSVLASIAFAFGLRRWAARFLQADVADLATLVLCSTPLWFWQSQFIQIDLVFSVLVAWAWLAWLGGYLCLRGLARDPGPGEAGRWFLGAYLALGLAFLAKGPLALVLSVTVLIPFLAWQRDVRVLGQMRLGSGVAIIAALAASWYVPAALVGGRDYAYALIVHQNFERATKAWDHVQPFWKYLEYMAGDFFPWVLLLPALSFFLKGSGALKSPAARFCLVAFIGPFLFLSWVQSKQGKYLLMSYPFLALLLAGMLQPIAVEGVSQARIRRLGGVLAAALWLPALALLAVGFGAGGSKLQAQVAPFLGPIRLMGILTALGALSVTTRSMVGEGQFLVRETALTLGLLFLVGGTWGFRRLDPQKNFRTWAAEVTPLIQGRQVYYWQTIRSGAMVYTDHLMPELRSAEDLQAKLGPEDRLVTMRREWDEDRWGMTPELRARFEVVLQRPSGGGEILLLRWKESR